MPKIFSKYCGNKAIKHFVVNKLSKKVVLNGTNNIFAPHHSTLYVLCVLGAVVFDQHTSVLLGEMVCEIFLLLN